MSNKELTGEEKRQKMKEQFKKELRERKEFLNKVKGLRRTQSINKALEGMRMEDDTDQWIEKLNQDTAFIEAKTEIALNTTIPSSVTANDPTLGQDLTISEEEMQKIAAEQMVERMKAELKAEVDGRIASPDPAPEREIQGKNTSSVGRLIEVEVSAEGEVTGAEEVIEPSSEEEGTVRKMMGESFEEK